MTEINRMIAALRGSKHQKEYVTLLESQIVQLQAHLKEMTEAHNIQVAVIDALKSENDLNIIVTPPEADAEADKRATFNAGFNAGWNALARIIDNEQRDVENAAFNLIHQVGYIAAYVHSHTGKLDPAWVEKAAEDLGAWLNILDIRIAKLNARFEHLDGTYEVNASRIIALRDGLKKALNGDRSDLDEAVRQADDHLEYAEIVASSKKRRRKRDPQTVAILDHLERFLDENPDVRFVDAYAIVADELSKRWGIQVTEKMVENARLRR